MRFWIWGWTRLFSICWYTIAHGPQDRVGGEVAEQVTIPIRTAAIVAPTSGTSENSPAITASGAAKDAEDLQHDEGRCPRDQRDQQRGR